MARIVSCFTNCFGAAGVRAAVESIRSCGIDHLELALRGHNFGGLVIPESAVITVDSDERSVLGFVELLHRHYVKVSGCNVGGADIRTDEGVDLTRRRIQFAKRWFDVHLVVSGAGQPSDSMEREVILKNLRRIGSMAGELGITVALETHKGPTQNAAAMLNLMNDLDHESIRLNFDTGNIAYYNQDVDPADQLELVKDLVRNVHLKDNRGNFEEWYFPSVGDGGAVDFRRIRTILDGVGYEGAYTIEIEGIAGEPEPGLDGRVERVKRSVDHLVTCGYFD